MHRPLALFLSPFPAFLGSLWIIHTAQAGSSSLLQQIVVIAAASAICGFAIFYKKNTIPLVPWILLAAALVGLVLPLLLPLLLAQTSEPQRWLEVGGFRFYVAALFLPTTVWLLTYALQTTHTRWTPIFCVIFGFILAAQPDASQVSAFSLACILAFFLTRQTLLAKLTILIALLICTAIAWLQPDLLQPVPHVEGVLTLALSVSPFALALALCALFLPVGALIWRARVSGIAAFYTVTVYYLAIGIFACFGLTPMPLLGFGAASVFGFFLLVFTSQHSNRLTY
jgi:cell division protein FtsW (lipid II flippase)